MTIPAPILGSARAAKRPVYVYDLAVLHARLRLLEALPLRRKRIHFATMANDHPQVLAAVSGAGHGIFVNSLAHLALARSVRVPLNRIIFAASNMSREEMIACIAADVHVVLDSLGQVAAFDALARPGTPVGIRVNVGSAIESPDLQDEPSYRFGLLPAEVPAAVKNVTNLRIVGVHAYFGTDIMDPSVLLTGLGRLARVGETVPDLEYVDGGGGFGIADDPAVTPFDLDAYGRGAAAIMNSLEARLRRRVTLIIEPGRWLAAPSGWFFTRVVDVKERHDRIFAGTTGSVAQFPRMLVYPERARHPCQIVDAEGRACAAKPVWFSGNSTYSRDYLARGVAIAMPQVGDLVAFHHAGAYCRSMLTRFLGKEQPDEILLDTDKSHARDVFIEAAE